MSANEHFVPEQFFNDPNATIKNVNGISAVKALQIAGSEGQKIFTVTQNNIDIVLPQINHHSETITDIRNAVAAGKVVTVSQNKVSITGWTGTGYIILDPNTGAGAYMIGGGSDGGAIQFLNDNSTPLTALVSLLSLMLTFPALTGLATTFMITTFIPFLIIALSALLIYATYISMQDSNCKMSNNLGIALGSAFFLRLGFALSAVTQLVANFLSTISSLYFVPGAIEEGC